MIKPPTIKTAALFAGIAILGGCAAIQIPSESLESNQSSIRGAEELGALNVPSARLHLEMAKDETITAKKLAEQGDDRALLVLARADSDAELALGMAREVSVHNDALKADEELRAVQARGSP